MITLLYIIFGRGKMLEYALTGVGDFILQSFLFLAFLAKLGVLK